MTLFGELRTNVKGPEATLYLNPVQGVHGSPRSGKSRFAQAVTLAITGSLPRLGRKADIIELVPKHALPSGTLYSELYGDSGNRWAKYSAELSSGKVDVVEHEISDPSLAGCLIAQTHGDLIELGDELSLKALYDAFGGDLDGAGFRGLNKRQLDILSALFQEAGPGSGSAGDLGILSEVETKIRESDKIVKAKAAELDALETAEAESGARVIECAHCGGHVLIPSPGRNAAKEIKALAEQEKEIYVGIASEIKRLMLEDLQSKRDDILLAVRSHMPTGIDLDLTIRKGRVGWQVLGVDGRPHGAKVSCGTERGSLAYALIRAWGAVRKSKGLPVFLLLDDINFVGLTLEDRRLMLSEVLEDVEEGKLDQAFAVSADDIFPDGWSVEEV